MRVALVHSTGTLRLAGDPALSEREHSSAADFRIDPRINVQTDAFVRGAAVDHTDRGNLASTVSFQTTRLFATPAEAEIWSALYDSVQPRAGTLLLESINGTTSTWTAWAGCVVQPPQRQVIGCTVLLSYSVLCGLAEAVTFASATLGPTATDNAILFTSAIPGEPGNATEVAIASPAAATAAATVAVVDSAITITPAAKGVLLVSGISNPTAANKVLYYAGTQGGKPIWTSDGINDISPSGRAVLMYSTDRWLYQYGSLAYSAYKVSAAAFPDGLTSWTVTVGSGSPTVGTAATTAAMAISLVNATPAAALLVVASVVPGYYGSGSLGAVATTHLTGGTGLAS